MRVTSILLISALIAPAAQQRVTSAADIARAAESARPGDVLIMADGAWTDHRIVFHAMGTAEQPVTLRAETAGKVVLGGESSMIIEGAHLVVSGLHFKDSTAKGDGIKLAGEHCRLTETAVTGGAHKFFVHVFGTENRMDHCYLADKTSDSPTLQIEAEGKPNRHRMDHNHFGPRPPLGRNGGETIRVGYSVEADAGFGSSGRSLRPEHITIANNLFALPKDGVLIKGTESATFQWKGNILTSDSPPFPHAGLSVTIAKLAKAADGLWRPAPDSAVRDMAEGKFPAVKTDIDGQPRDGRADIGCDPLSEAPLTRRLLTPKDTGPSWMERTLVKP